MFRWPSSFCTTRKSTPFMTSQLAKQWRRSCHRKLVIPAFIIRVEELHRADRVVIENALSVAPREKRLENSHGFVDGCWGNLLNAPLFNLFNFGRRYLCQWRGFTELPLPELQYRLDEFLVRTVMDLRILPVFFKGRSQGNILGNQLVPRAFLNFRDLETPPALSLALSTEALFLATAIRKAHLNEIPFAFGIPYRTI